MGSNRLAIVATILSVWTIAATSVHAEDMVAQVTRLEAERRRAMIAVDIPAIEALFADDAVYVHSNGLEQTKAGMIAMLAKKELRYVSFDIKATNYRAYGDAVVCNGTQLITLTSSGTPFESNSRYVIVYAMVGGAPRIVAYQSTLLPEIVKQETKRGE